MVLADFAIVTTFSRPRNGIPGVLARGLTADAVRVLRQLAASHPDIPSLEEYWSVIARNTWSSSPARLELAHLAPEGSSADRLYQREHAMPPGIGARR